MYIKISRYNTLVQQFYRIYDSMQYVPMYLYQFMIQKGMHIYILHTKVYIYIYKQKQKEETKVKIMMTDQYYLYIY